MYLITIIKEKNKQTKNKYIYMYIKNVINTIINEIVL